MLCCGLSVDRATGDVIVSACSSEPEQLSEILSLLFGKEPPLSCGPLSSSEISCIVGKRGISIRRMQAAAGLDLSIREDGDGNFKIYGWLKAQSLLRLMRSMMCKIKRTTRADCVSLVQFLHEKFDRGRHVIKAELEKIQRKNIHKEKSCTAYEISSIQQGHSRWSVNRTRRRLRHWRRVSIR